jgi:hypothetical protein
MVKEVVSSAGWFFREIIRILSHYLVFTIVAGNFYAKILVDIKRQWLIG